MANVHRTGGKNQKVVKTQKDKCNKENLYATINLAAMGKAAQELKPNSFKLWIYFSKNQDGYEFALSSKAVERDFGIKKDAYDGAIKELLDKGYLAKQPDTDEEDYYFYETPRCSKNPQGVIGKNHNEPDPKKPLVVKNHNPLMVKTHNGLQEKTITGYSKSPQQILQNNTINNTINNTLAADAAAGASGHKESPIMVDQEWIIERYNDCIHCANGLYQYRGKFYKVKPQT